MSNRAVPRRASRPAIDRAAHRATDDSRRRAVHGHPDDRRPPTSRPAYPPSCGCTASPAHRPRRCSTGRSSARSPATARPASSGPGPSTGPRPSARAARGSRRTAGATSPPARRPARFWLLLLPFTLANVAMWLRPPATGMGRRLRARPVPRSSRSRMSGHVHARRGRHLRSTSSRWQCAATPDSRCVDARPWLQFLFTGFFEPTGRRLALAALGPIFVVVAAVVPRRADLGPVRVVRSCPQRNPDGDGLATPTFWDGRAQVGRLRSLHVAADVRASSTRCCSTSAATTTERPTRTPASTSAAVAPSAVVTAGRGARRRAAWPIIALCVLLLLLSVAWWTGSRSRPAREPDRQGPARGSSLLLTVLTLGLRPGAPGDLADRRPAARLRGTVTGLFAAQTGHPRPADAGRAVPAPPVQGRLARPASAPRSSPRWASGLGAAFSAGVVLPGRRLPRRRRGAQPGRLRRHSRPTLAAAAAGAYQWAAFGFVLLVAGRDPRAAVGPPGHASRCCAGKARPDTDDDYPGGRSATRGRAEHDRPGHRRRAADRPRDPHASPWPGWCSRSAGVVPTGLALREDRPGAAAPIRLGRPPRCCPSWPTSART